MDFVTTQQYLMSDVDVRMITPSQQGGFKVTELTSVDEAYSNALLQEAT